MRFFQRQTGALAAGTLTSRDLSYALEPGLNWERTSPTFSCSPPVGPDSSRPPAARFPGPLARAALRAVHPPPGPSRPRPAHPGPRPPGGAVGVVRSAPGRSAAARTVLPPGLAGQRRPRRRRRRRGRERAAAAAWGVAWSGAWGCSSAGTPE
ncbi:translation initiation factor IF-2 [Macaca nemestrina]|uniref:translation initiation factor IF-2 n=1 Tax=Macaca nemestrina TaxID=9545 RepID=UPI0039B8AA98